MMRADYPNLELLEYMFKQKLMQDEAFKKKSAEIKEKQKFLPLEFNTFMFPQVWPSTCGGIDEMPNGEAAWGGQSITKMYTTVIHENITDSFIVFFGDRPAYQVHDANDDFIEDMKRQKLAPLSEAKKRY